MADLGAEDPRDGRLAHRASPVRGRVPDLGLHGGRSIGIVLETAAEREPRAPAGRRLRWRPLLLELALGLVLALVGLWLLTPGGSLAVPTLVVGGGGAVLAVLAWLAACLRPWRRERWVFAVASLAVTAGATFWTLELAMPAALIFDAGATRQAQALLAGVRRAAAGSPLAVAHRCHTVTTGSSALLAAPYQACATWTSRWHFVLFTKTGTGRGAGYTNAGAANFADRCSRHLTGLWWAYTRDTSGIGDCPFGYSFHGGG